MALNKGHRTIRKMRVKASQIIDVSEMDKQVIDIVLHTLYNNSDIDTMQLEEQIYKPNSISLNKKDAERLWEVMISSGWISPVVGFGNVGKISLTRDGYKLMAQFGSYMKYLEAVNTPQAPSTVILPLQVQEEQDPEITPPTEKKKNKK
jgi:hypothetical protein